MSQFSLLLVGKERGKSTRKCESMHNVVFWRGVYFLLLYIYSCMILIFTWEVSWKRKYYLSKVFLSFLHAEIDDGPYVLSAWLAIFMDVPLF